jgi:hypothetical protein
MSFGVSSVKSANLTAPALFILSSASPALDCVTGDAGWLRSFDDVLFEDLHSIACDRIGAVLYRAHRAQSIARRFGAVAQPYHVRSSTGTLRTTAVQRR